MRRCTNAVMVVGLLLVATGASWAFSLFDYVEEGTKIEMKFKNWDVGVIYDVPDGTYTGAGALDLLTQTKPTGAAAGEDSWGIFKLAEIYVEGAVSPFWSSTTAPEELTGIFWGERDTYLKQTTDAGQVAQTIHGDGVHLAFFSQLKADPFFTAFNNLLGPGARVDIGAKPTFPTVTDGTLLWTINSIPGAGGAAFPTDEFFSNFIPSAAYPDSNSDGKFWADDGLVPGWGVGPGNTEFGQYIPGKTDMVFKFTGTPDPAGKWIVASNDPILAATSPELSSSALMLLGFIPMGLGWWRRRKA